jgi:4-carboxymuconolactone decarboxylase
LTQGDGLKDLRKAAADFRRRYYGPRGNPGPPSAMAELAPEVMESVDSVLYGEIYNRPAVNLQTRSLCTIAALTVLGHNPQLIRRHIQGALHVGVTKEQIVEIISQMVFYGGMPAAINAFRVAKETFDDALEPWPEGAKQAEERSGLDEPVAVVRPPTIRFHQSRPPSDRSRSTPRTGNQRPGAGPQMDRQSSRPSTSRPSTSRASTSRPSTSRPSTSRPSTSRPSTSRPSKGGRPGQRAGTQASTRPPQRGGGGPGRKRNPGKPR